ncbi:myb-like protein A [Ipomoea triloba]|uniref:myb-like protein A n=1 Tax=Ipomoea triloba TaxID=35885 RepID=UPI00125DB48B|nr:myb-like protein A [Ipomoea triloba]
MEDWIRTFDKLFDAVNCPMEHRVDTAAYYLQQEADNWWANVGPVLRQQPNFGWETFKEEMRGRFYPAHVKMAKYDEFLHLRQPGSMTVQEYYAKFLALARFSPALVPDEPRKAEKFINGLNFETQKVVCALTFQTLNEAYSSAASHYRVQQIQKDINGRNKRKIDDDVQQGDKRPKFNSFEPNRNFQRNSNNNNGRNRQGQGQGFVKRNQMGDRHFNCRICKRDHPGTDCQGNLVKCYNCNKMGHRAYECYAKKNGDTQNQGQNMNGSNQNGNRPGNPGNRGGNGGGNHNQGNKNGNNNNYTQNKNGGNGQGRIFVMSRAQAEANDVVSGIFLVNSIHAYVLFDSGASNSFISSTFVKKLGIEPTSKIKINVKIASGRVMTCEDMYENLSIVIAGTNFPGDLIQFELDDIDVVLGMDWLGKFKAKIICNEQKVILRGTNGKRVSYKGNIIKLDVKLVTMQRMKKYVEKGHEAY